MGKLFWNNVTFKSPNATNSYKRCTFSCIAQKGKEANLSKTI